MILPRLTRDWEGETVFVIAGGPSVTQADVDRLRGQRVVVINSSYACAPWADALVFTDLRWWRAHRVEILKVFAGEVITITPHSHYHDPHLLVLERQRSSGLSHDTSRLVCWHTSVTTTINMIALRGATRIAMLGLDGEGDWHHEAHPKAWGRNANKFRYHGEALRELIEPLAAIKVEVFNLNRNSKHDMFPFTDLDELIA